MKAKGLFLEQLPLLYRAVQCRLRWRWAQCLMILAMPTTLGSKAEFCCIGCPQQSLWTLMVWLLDEAHIYLYRREAHRNHKMLLMY